MYAANLTAGNGMVAWPVARNRRYVGRSRCGNCLSYMREIRTSKTGLFTINCYGCGKTHAVPGGAR